MNLMYQALKRIGGDTRLGLMHALGADPRRVSSAGMEMHWLGRHLKFGSDELLPQMAKATESLSYFGMATSAVPPVMMGVQMLQGFSEGGARGAIGAFTTEVAVNAAMVNHAYSRIHEGGGVYRLVAGKYPGAKLLGRMGKVGAVAGAGLGFADITSRYMWGTAMASGFSHALGGGVLGTAGAMIGGHLGVKYAGALTMGLAASYGAKAVAMGGYTILKSGYDYRQSRRQLNTDGDMAAFMTTGAQTMRERAVSAIQKSYINNRSALGQEAQYLSFPSRSYSSIYRQGY